jgi:outer membrane immunogenic protein
MNRFALCVVAAALSTSAALAADLPLKARPMAVDPSYNWTGFYIGVNGGGAWSEDRDVFLNETFSGAPFFSGTFGTRHAEGAFGGVQAGSNWQSGRWVFGIEGDVDGANIRGSTLATVTPYLTAGNSITFGTSERLDFFATLRGRFGYAFDRFLIYVTGGAAVGQTRSMISMVDTFGFTAGATDTTWRGGYAVGGGGEYAFGPNWSAKVEYQYINLGKGSLSAREFVGGSPSTFFVFNSTVYDYHTVRIGLNYKLNWGGPVVAKY